MSCVSTVFDPGTEREDHRPVFATMTAELSAGRGRARIRREKFDVRRLLTPQGKATFTAELEKFRHPAWSCHPDLHYQQIQEHVLRIMRSHFPLPVNGPRATFIEPGTWALRDRIERASGATSGEISYTGPYYSGVKEPTSRLRTYWSSKVCSTS